MTAAMRASWSRRTGCLELLVAAGANLNQQDKVFEGGCCCCKYGCVMFDGSVNCYDSKVIGMVGVEKLYAFGNQLILYFSVICGHSLLLLITPLHRPLLFVFLRSCMFVCV